MRNIFVASCLLIVSCTHLESIKPPENMIGLWQFPDRGVWVQVEADGSTLQCRYAPSGTVFTSKGNFVSPGKIRWYDIWGTDQVSLTKGELVLAGKWGTFAYRKYASPMHEKCTVPAA